MRFALSRRTARPPHPGWRGTYGSEDHRSHRATGIAPISPSTNGGWLDTRDRVCIDGDGWVTYRCRADDTEIVGGVNVNPREVERLIIEDDTVAEAAVVGVRESTGASALQAFLVPTNDALIDESAIRDIHRQLLTRLSAFKVPHRFAIVERLPRTATGKVLRGALRAESPAKPIWELPLIDPESDGEAQLDNRPASNVQMVVGNSGEMTLNERLAVLRREQSPPGGGRGLYRDRENVGPARSAVGRSGSRLLGAGL